MSTLTAVGPPSRPTPTGDGGGPMGGATFGAAAAAVRGRPGLGLVLWLSAAMVAGQAVRAPAAAAAAPFHRHRHR